MMKGEDMSKKSPKKNRGLVQQKSDVAAAAILAHPVFRDVAQRLETMHRMMKDLPAVIGEAVAEATRRPPAGASGPPVPVIEPKTIEIHGKTLIINGKTYVLKE
jgi:hypothetical protein